jgi:hypothetical protein
VIPLVHARPPQRDACGGRIATWWRSVVLGVVATSDGEPHAVAEAQEREAAAADWEDLDRTLKVLGGRGKQELKLPGKFGYLELSAVWQGVRAS